MRNRFLLYRFAVAVVATVVLLLPSAVTGLVWTLANFLVAACLVAVSVVSAIYQPKLKWIFALIASLMIAIPPYPNWLYWSEDRGWYFHLGSKLENLQLFTFSVHFVIAALAFIALFWAMKKTDVTADI